MKVLTKRKEVNVKKLTEAVAQKCSVKKVVFRNFAKFTGNTCAKFSFSIKLQPPDLQLC